MVMSDDIKDLLLSEGAIIGLGALAASHLRRFSQVTFYLDSSCNIKIALPAEVRLVPSSIESHDCFSEEEIKKILLREGFTFKETSDYIQQRIERRLRDARNL